MRRDARGRRVFIAQHGTRSAYTNGGCRCPECREAERVYQIEHERPRDKFEALLQPAYAVAKTLNADDPISDLDLMIANGYGDIPQTSLPEDWRTNPKRRRSQTKGASA